VRVLAWNIRWGGKDRPGIARAVSAIKPDAAILTENILGGQDFQLSNGKTITCQRNIFGGRDYRTENGKTVTCRPNIFNGVDCR